MENWRCHEFIERNPRGIAYVITFAMLYVALQRQKKNRGVKCVTLAVFYSFGCLRKYRALTATATDESATMTPMVKPSGTVPPAPPALV
jgi:hypothetical protein